MNDTRVSVENPTTTPLAELERHFDLDAGLACLDFVNTLRGRLDATHREYLPTYADLIAFARVTGDIDAATAENLAALAEAHSVEARATLAAATHLRETLYRIFSAVAAESAPADSDLEIFNSMLLDEAEQSRLVANDGGFHWIYRNESDLARPIWPIAREAANVLLGDERERLRECAADDCGWIFLDTSRNRSRRWCSMSSCGNRAKVQQFRQRQRGVGNQG